MSNAGEFRCRHLQPQFLQLHCVLSGCELPFALEFFEFRGGFSFFELLIHRKHLHFDLLLSLCCFEIGFSLGICTIALRLRGLHLFQLIFDLRPEAVAAGDGQEDRLRSIERHSALLDKRSYTIHELGYSVEELTHVSFVLSRLSIDSRVRFNVDAIVTLKIVGKQPHNFLGIIWKHHNLHHYVGDDGAFCVSSPFWDYIFGTMPKAPRRKEAERVNLL